MLKKFFISMLGTMAGIWLSLIIIVIGLMLMISNFFAGNINPHLHNDKVLSISLQGDIPEYSDENDVMLFASQSETGDPLCSILTAIRRAADDDKVKGIFLDCRGSTLGIASREELQYALSKFRETGKWVYAYADEFTQGDYLVATAADKVYLNPVGSLDIHGICATVYYYTDILKNIGVNMQVVKVGDFKSAVEPFLRMDMSEADRTQTSLYVGNIWLNYREMASANRGISPDSINAWADDFAFTLPPERFVDAGAIDGLRYLSEVTDEMCDLLELDDDEELPLVSVTEYLAVTGSDAADPEKPHIAVLYAVGDITESGLTGIASDAMVPVIEDLAADDNVKGLILRVNSGGGSAFASEQIWHALEGFKATGKPFYVSMGDMAASGGYYISCGADRIYADATTITGSIGIFGVIPEAQDLLRDKLHLGWDSVSTNANAAFPSLMYPMTERQLQGMQQYVERGYETFVGRVSEGRGMSVSEVKAIGGGRVWDGSEALGIGLVDRIGTLDNAMYDMTQACGLEDDDYVNYPDITFSLSSLFTSGVSIKLDVPAAEQLSLIRDLYKLYGPIHPLQARMHRVTLE